MTNCDCVFNFNSVLNELKSLLLSLNNLRTNFNLRSTDSGPLNNNNLIERNNFFFNLDYTKILLFILMIIMIFSMNNKFKLKNKKV